jgi:uncharacterized membrane protein YccC
VLTAGGVRRALLAADPGLQRTYFAGRTTLSVGITLAVVFPLARAAGQPATVGLLAVSVAQVAAMAVSGPTAAAQLRGAGLAALAAAGAVTLGALVAPYPLLGSAAFVAVMAAAGWAGGFGPRGRGLGMVAFMTFFFALFTRATLQGLPWLLGAAAGGAAVAGIVRALLLRDPPGPRLPRLLVALRARIESLARDAERARAAPAVDDGARRALADASIGVDEVVLPLHDLLRDSPQAVADPGPFQRHLFAVVTLTHLLVLRAVEGRQLSGAALVGPPVEPGERLRVHLDALEAAAEGRPAPEIPDARDGSEGEGDPDDAPNLPAPSAAADPARGSTRTAAQLAVAGVAAIAVGHLLSPHRWYWAGITAFLIFVNTGSRGATLRRAVERMLGTAVGIAGGMLAAALLAGRSGVELLAIFPLLFAAYWMFQTSQVVMVGMITILFALMYDMMGMLSLHLMLLRLAETAAGAVVGVLAAYLVVPERTRGALDQAFDGFFAALDGLLAALAGAARAPADARVLDAIRELDRAVGTLRGTVRPLIDSIPGRRSRALRREFVLALTARYWVHRAAGRLIFHVHPVDAEVVERRVARVRERLSALRDGRPTPPAGAPGTVQASPLLRADAVLADLARARAARP